MKGKNKKGTAKKKAQQEIRTALTAALGNWQETMGKKKFERRIKKAAKDFGRGVSMPSKPEETSVTPASSDNSPA